MAIFKRISDILKANINDLLDKAEDPEKMVKQLILEMEDQVDVATQGLGQAMASEKIAKSQLEQAKENVLDWENKAKAALKQGNEDLARKALDSKVGVEKQVAVFEQSYQKIAEQTAKLRDQVRALKAKLEEARARENLIIARAQMAEATEGVARTISSTSTDSAFAKLEKMEQKVAEKEAIAAAFTEINADDYAPVDEFAIVERNQAVEDELARLKSELGL
ncbi:MAG: PspA/IM30 family protein [bacterium]|nr:PspA/IM30 family protein [bacterium]